MAPSKKTNKKSLKTFLHEVTAVLKAADDSLNLLQTRIPVNFHEKSPSLIGKSFVKFIASDHDFKTTTVVEKIDAEQYESVYPLYHDIRLSAFVLLHQLDIGSALYVEVDKYYKFASEFILRECFRLNITITEFTAVKNTNEAETSDFEELLSQDFAKISTSYLLSNSEAFQVTTTSNIPLFSSFNQRSALDEREIEVPEQFTITKILPHSHTPQSKDLGFVSPVSNRIPPNNQTNQILNRFLHPNWYSLPTAKWLEKSDFRSFAPVIDEQNIVVSSEDKSRLWFEHVGYKKFQQALEDEANAVAEGDKEEKKEEETEGKGAKEQGDNKLIDVDVEEELGSVNLENLYSWAPDHEIEDDEIEAFESGKETQLVNSLLEKLHNLRKDRWDSGLQTPSMEEVKIYQKAKRLLTEIVLASDKVPDVKPSSNIPILQTEYTGTLPTPTQSFAKTKKNKTRR